ncbi:hypothetical protein K3181_12080 [Qipengyuania sp. YG27]|uniref:Histidinol dehydrogenase n=1 Tax=Qipengyuania mesophila TaxID=2867246 RepID=A0ABS7JX11_9SPHN|nr:hypothetical protein [Qipengyuania mesophila]MBX7502181.1 hypothetical protein [Qipengyuania mesophila]
MTSPESNRICVIPGEGAAAEAIEAVLALIEKLDTGLLQGYAEIKSKFDRIDVVARPWVRDRVRA